MPRGSLVGGVGGGKLIFLFMKVRFVCVRAILGDVASLVTVEVSVVGVGRGWLLVLVLSGNESPQLEQLGE